MSASQVSIAVMPFRNLSPESDTDYFANGFVEDLTSDLTKFNALRVVAMQTTFAAIKNEIPVSDFAEEYSLDFVLQGSVRRDKVNLRVSVQLNRADGQETLWAERFDAPLENVFSIQDQISATVASRLALEVNDAVLENARRRSKESLPAYDNWLRGMDCLNRGTLEGDEESRQFFQQALEIDPGFARAYTGLSLSHFNEWTCQAWHLWDENERNAFDFASQAIQLDDRDAIVHSVLARVYRFRREHSLADQHANRALALNPNDPHVLIQVAIVRLFGGQPEAGLKLARKAIELNPLHGNWYWGIVGWNLFMMNQYDEAYQNLRKGGNTITNFAAYRSACAVAGKKPSLARDEYNQFQQEYQCKIAFGREPVYGEAVTWAVQVEPFADLNDSLKMPDLLKSGKIAEIDVSAAIHSRREKLVRPAGIRISTANVFRSSDGVWQIDYQGIGARLVELKGFHDIARLLSQPNEQLHALELVGAGQTHDASDEVLDEKARQDYRRRIEELQEELEQAEADNDPARLEPARQELDAVIDELARATGLSGRSRKLGRAAEKARSTVTWRIRSAIKKISSAHPQLGQHFSNSIHTGNFCVYSPEVETLWEL